HERLPNVVSLIPPKHWALRWADGLILRVEPLKVAPDPRPVLLLAPPSRAQRITPRGDTLTGLNWNSSAVRDRVGDGFRVRGNTDLHRVGAREDRRSRVDGERPKPCRAPSRIPFLEIRISKTGLCDFARRSRPAKIARLNQDSGLPKRDRHRSPQRVFRRHLRLRLVRGRRRRRRDGSRQRHSVVRILYERLASIRRPLRLNRARPRIVPGHIDRLIEVLVVRRRLDAITHLARHA